ncbi:hypothetical protein MZ16F91_07610 [Escherichia coli]
MYKWSAKNNAFFPVEDLARYCNGWDLTDLVDIEQSAVDVYNSRPPEGKIRIAGKDGMPSWGDIPEIPSEAEQAS